MGLKSLFSREADLTNLFEQSNIYADKLIHKAKVTFPVILLFSKVLEAFPILIFVRFLYS